MRIVVPFTAGGAADTLGRLHADALNAAFGRQFHVENRPTGPVDEFVFRYQKPN